MGEDILNHYENYLGSFEESIIFKSTEDMPSIQFLRYDNVFEGCQTFATLGLSKFSQEIANTCEVVLVVDDDYEDAASILANALFYIINNGLKFGRGTYIEGIENVNSEFAMKHGKSAVYFTEAYSFPDEFSNVNNAVKMYMTFYISKKECEFIKTYGCEKFEDLLEENECDIMDLNR